MLSTPIRVRWGPAPDRLSFEPPGRPMAIPVTRRTVRPPPRLATPIGWIDGNRQVGRAGKAEFRSSRRPTQAYAPFVQNQELRRLILRGRCSCRVYPTLNELPRLTRSAPMLTAASPCPRIAGSTR